MVLMLRGWDSPLSGLRIQVSSFPVASASVRSDCGTEQRRYCRLSTRYCRLITWIPTTRPRTVQPESGSPSPNSPPATENNRARLVEAGPGALNLLQGSELRDPDSRARGDPRAGADRLLHDATVEEVHCAVRRRCITGIVRDHADRRATAMQLVNQLHHRLAVRRD